MGSIPGNNKYSNKYISEHKGIYPVYSAKTTGDMAKGYIDTYDYDCSCIQITTNGANAGTVILRLKQKFSVGSDTRIYSIKEGYSNMLDLEYMCYELKQKLIGYSWTNKAGKSKIANTKIQIPIHPDGTFDLEKQKEIAEKYRTIEAIKVNINQMIKEILDVYV